MKKGKKLKYQKTLINGKMLYYCVVYVYTLKATGECYVGLSTWEKHRIDTWKSVKCNYAGPKINAARKQHGISMKVWDYNVVEIITEEELDKFIFRMDERETYWIKYYDSYYHGFNGNLGGKGRKGIGHTPSQESAIIQASIKPVKVTMNGETKTYSSRREAAKALSVSPSTINYYLNSGKIHQTKGFSIQAA